MQKESDKSESVSLLNRFRRALRTNKKLELALYGGIVACALLLYFAGSAWEKNKSSGNVVQVGANQSVYSETDVEERLKKVLSCIRGAGKVEVMITYDTGTELVTAMSQNINSNSSETTDGDKTSATTQRTETSEPATVSAQGGNSPIVLLEKQPVVRGVIVVAEGAADIRVMLDLQRAVRAVLDIPISNIEVFEYTAKAMD